MACRKFDRDDGMYGWLVCVIIVLGALVVICWLSVTPANPEFRITRVQFPTRNSMNSTARDQNTTVADNTMLVDLQIYNPNKHMEVYYNNISLQLYRDGGGIVGTDSIQGFYQGYKNTTSFHSMLYEDREFSEGVRYRIHVETAIRFKIIRWKTMLKQIKYEELSVMPPNNPCGTASEGNSTQQQDTSKMTT